MVQTRYRRSDVLSYHDLTPTQQVNAVSNYFNNDTQAQQEQYVLAPDTDHGEHSPLPLCMFMRTKSPVWDGVYGTSYFSAYFIKLSKCGTQAVVAERFS